MAEVFAGFVAGFALAIITTPLLALLLFRTRTTSPLLARLLPAGTPVTSIAVLVHGALVMFWTGLGMVLGLVLLAMRDAEGALGSRNGPYTLFVAGLTLAILAPVAVLMPRSRLVILAAGAVVLVVFGWLTPYLAEWSNFD